MAENLQDKGAAEDSGQSGGANPSSVKVSAKVELDLDDSPFLDDDEPDPEPEPEKEVAPPADVVAPAQVEPSSFKDRLLASKKKLILIGGGTVLLLVVAIAVKLFFFSTEKTPPPPPPEPEVIVEEPAPPPPPPVQTFVMQWEPFWVELKDTEGDSRFLTVQFNVPTENPVLFGEMNGKKFILRDAIFYYLRNQPIISLRDEARVQAFKSDLLTVMNEHLGSGKVSELLIQEYLVQ